MSVYEFDMNPNHYDHHVIVSTRVRMSGTDAEVNESTAYTMWELWVLEYDDNYTLSITPIADDGSTEYDTPYVYKEFEPTADLYELVYPEYDEWVHRARMGTAETLAP